MNNLTKPIIIGAVIIAVSVLGSQYMKQQSIEAQQQAELRAEQDKALRESLAETERQRNIDLCISDSYQVYSGNWDNACNTLSRPKDCSLPGYRAEELEAERIRAEEACYKRFK